MRPTAAPSLLGLYSSVSDGTAIAAGRHVRALFHPALGLPCAPLLVYRVPLGIPGKQTPKMTAPLTWVGPTNKTETLPLTVPDSLTVTGWTPTALAAAVWLEADGLTRMDAIADGPDGPAITASRTRPPWLVSAPRIDRVVVHGPGVITAAAALAPSSADAPGRPHWMWSLPVTPQPWYAPTPAATTEAKHRVLRGAPPRRGLADDPTSSGPATTEPATPQEELARIEESWKLLGLPLATILGADVAPRDVVVRHDSVTATGANLTFGADPVGGALVASLDPGVARWLGLADVDPDPPGGLGGPDALIGYAVRALFPQNGFAPDPAREAAWDRALDPVLGAITTAPDQLWRDVVDMTAASAVRGYLDLEAWTVVHATGDQDPPPPPVAATTSSGPWLPDPTGGPDLRCTTRISLTGIDPAAGLAATRAGTSGTLTLNSQLPETGRGVIIVAAASEVAGNATLSHQAPDGDPAHYRIAQASIFGRWSNWLSIDVPAADVPGPPPAAPQIHYQPAAPDAHDNLPHPGTVLIQVRQPTHPTAGARPITTAQADLTTPDGGTTTGSAPATDHPTNPTLITITGPPLGPGERRDARIVARWLDVNGTAGPDSPSYPIVLWDPRAPQPPAVPPLIWAAPADVLGRAWITLSWPADTATAGYRVFLGGEQGILGRLQAAGATDPAVAAAATELAAALARDVDGQRPPVSVRVTALADAARLADRGAFELITSDLVTAPTGSTTVTFRWALPASLATVAVFRVVPVSVAGAETAFTSCAVTCAAVPDDRMVGTPVLRGPSRTAPPNQLQATVGPSPVPAGRWRLFRSRLTGGDLGSMALVAEGDAPPGSDPSRPFTFTVTDPGTGPYGPQLPWARYTYRLTVRAAAPPGVPAETLPWSPPSPPVSVDVVPASTPTTPVPEPPYLDGDVLCLPFQVPQPLGRGPIGEHRFLVWRTPPDQSAEELAYTFTDGGDDRQQIPIARPVVDGMVVLREPPSRAQPGTSYRLTVVDPIGRSSAASAAVAVSN